MIDDLGEPIEIPEYVVKPIDKVIITKEVVPLDFNFEIREPNPIFKWVWDWWNTRTDR